MLASYDSLSSLGKTSKGKSTCSTFTVRPLLWLIVVIIAIVFITTLLQSDRRQTREDSGEFINVENGNMITINDDVLNGFSDGSSEHMEGFAEENVSVAPRYYPMKKRQHFKLRAKQYVPFVVVLPGVPGECDFDGTTSTLQDADLIVMRDGDIPEKVEQPGHCNNKKLFQLVATRPGIKKFTVFYYHRYGHTEYIFTVYVK